MTHKPCLKLRLQPFTYKTCLKLRLQTMTYKPCLKFMRLQPITHVHSFNHLTTGLHLYIVFVFYLSSSCKDQ